MKKKSNIKRTATVETVSESMSGKKYIKRFALQYSFLCIVRRIICRYMKIQRSEQKPI